MNNNTLNLYLSGCMSYYYTKGEYHKATEWRIELAQKLLDSNADICSNHFNWFDPTLNFKDNVQVANNKTVVQQNNYYLDKCDIMIVNLDNINQSMGTLYEVFYYKIHNKPVIAFGDTEWINNPHLAESITIRLDTLDDVVEYLSDYYRQ